MFFATRAIDQYFKVILPWRVHSQNSGLQVRCKRMAQGSWVCSIRLRRLDQPTSASPWAVWSKPLSTSSPKSVRRLCGAIAGTYEYIRIIRYRSIHGVPATLENAVHFVCGLTMNDSIRLDTLVAFESSNFLSKLSRHNRLLYCLR